ncbi:MULTISPECIES: adenylate/guanylate cyclase domain-containing protein [unclassified Bradyrhizobium]|uniref:adenylate/guanylate cyclase domain-containing protein n=1 Tax=unclassified Bradyrhizobium TaxID=2631580 RepID=UPI002FEFF292
MSSERVERRLAAVLAADVAGYSCLMGREEEGTLAQLKSFRRGLIDPAIAEHRGRIVKTTGDGMLVEFASAVDAARCAVEVQRSMAEQNAAVPQDQRIEFRVGIHVGDIIIDENDIFGDAVNIAARLEGIAEPGGVCISDDAQRQLRGKVDIGFDDLGLQTLKNIAEPMRAWRMQIGNVSASPLSKDVSAKPSQPLALPDKPSIAALPFRNMSGELEQDYFTDGITEDIITALSKWRWFFVIARNSSFSYKGRHVDVREIGRELGVHYVLDGSVRRAGGRVRVTAQLVDTATGTSIWADRYDRDLTDGFAIQDEVAQDVATAIEPAVSKIEIERARRKTPEQMAARDHYFRGMWHFHQFSREDSHKAIACFNRAIELDNTLADAYVGIARTLFSTHAYRLSSGCDVNAQIASAAKSALALDPSNASACYILALNLAHNDDCETAIKFARRAIELNDNFALGYFALAVASNFLGQPQEALAAIDRALRLSPNDPQIFAWRAQRASALYLLKRYVEAAETARQSLGQRWFHTACRVLAASYAQLDMIEPARTTMRELLASEHSEKSIAEVIRPFKRADDRNNYIEGLRKAGMPQQ